MSTTYCSIGRLRGILAPGGNATDQEPTEKTSTAADLSNSELQDALDEAAAYIDTALAGRYATPVNNPPDAITFWCRNIAAYLATCTWRKTQSIEDDSPVARRYAMTMQTLRDAANGTYPLSIKTNTTSTAAAGGHPAINPRPGTLFPGTDLDLSGGYGSGWPYDADGLPYGLTMPEPSTDFFEQLQRGAQGT